MTQRDDHVSIDKLQERPRTAAEWERAVELLRIGVGAGIHLWPYLTARAVDALAQYGEVSEVFAYIVAIAAEHVHSTDAPRALAMLRRASFLLRQAGHPQAAVRVHMDAIGWELPSIIDDAERRPLAADRAVIDLVVESAVMWWEPSTLAYEPSRTRRSRWLVSVPRAACRDAWHLREQLGRALASRFQAWNRAIHAQPSDPTYLAPTAFEHRVLEDLATLRELRRFSTRSERELPSTWLFEEGRSFRITEAEFAVLSVLPSVQRGELTKDDALQHLRAIGLHPSVSVAQIDHPQGSIRALLDSIGITSRR